MDPKNPEVLTKYGAFLHSQEIFDKARSVIYECIQLQPEYSHQNYMLLGELVQGKQSIECYQKGIEILEKKLLSIFDDPDETKKDLALAYSAMAEIYQSDLISDKTSEKKCYQTILKALEYDPLCLDAYIQFANYFLNKGDEKNAKLMLKKIVEEIQEQNRVMTIFEQAQEVETIPYELRLNVSKLLVELQEWDDSRFVLNGLYDEDSTDLDVVYMLAFVNFKLQRYSQVSDLFKQLEAEDFTQDQELFTAFEELKQEFDKVNYNPEEDNDNCLEEEEINEDWMDIE